MTAAELAPDPVKPPPPAGDNAAVLLDGVVKRFGSVTALAGINARVQSGRLTGLVGPDGAGKTTLMRIMAGLMAPSEGRAIVAGLDVTDKTTDIHTRIGYMPQRFGLYEDLSVQENMALYAELRSIEAGRQKEIFDRLLDFTKLAPFTTRLAGKLSGGMKQKLGLACALMGEPDVLLLDEPGVGVDPVSRQDLWRMVHDLIADGMAVLWSTAYLDEAERCESVLLLNEGQVLYDGPPGDLTAKLADRSFKIGGAKEDRRQVLSSALQLSTVCDGVIQGDAVRVVLRKDADAGEIKGLAQKVGGELTPAPARFEDAFVDLLGGGPGGVSAIAERMEETTLDVDVTVSCRDLTRRFGDFVATDSVSFDVAKGEIFGLLGPNGAGKSTTFKMLCGLLKPSGGEARVVGHDLRTAQNAIKAQLGYMAQKFSLYGLLSVRQNLTFYSGVYGLEGAERAERIEEMIQTLQLEKYLDASPGDLPLGYRQRLAMACALMHRPAILFLDEPTSGVDPLTRREFWTHINGLARKKVTIMVTTHFMDEAEYCDRVALMYRAKVIALGTPDELKRQVTRDEKDNPTMEDAFIRLVEGADAEPAKAGA